MRRFRKNVKTPARFQGNSVAAIRPRNESLVKKQNEPDAERPSSPSTNSPPTTNLPVQPEQSSTTTFSNVLLFSEQSVTENFQASAGHLVTRNRVEEMPKRFYLAKTWDDLTDTAKLILMCEVGDHFDGNFIHSAKFLQLDNREIHKICDLQEEEKQREEQLMLDVNKHNSYLLSLDDISKRDLTGAEQRAIESYETEQRLNLKELAPSGYNVHREDITAARWFLRARCEDGLVSQAVMKGLLDYIDQDYSLQILGSVFHDDELEDKEEKNIESAPPDVLQHPMESSSSSSSSSYAQHLPRVRSHLNIVETAKYKL